MSVQGNEGGNDQLPVSLKSTAPPENWAPPPKMSPMDALAPAGLGMTDAISVGDYVVADYPTTAAG